MKMNMLHHLCLTDQTNNLERWFRAFPEGVALAAVAALPEDTSNRLVWLHTRHATQGPVAVMIQVIKQQSPAARIIVISDTPSQTESLLALSAGAVGYCHAQATPELLQQIAVVVANGGLWVGTDLMDRLLAAAGQVFAPTENATILADLTPREKEVALAVAKGHSNREVAVKLDVSERTIKAHLSVIFEKLAIRDRLQLAVLLRRENSSVLA
jgi:DNA-binding NarL/FixJ family response regulator